MKFLRTIFASFCMLLLVVPAAEKLLHELRHAKEPHCNIKARHYCQAEEHCPVCDYLSGSVAMDQAGNSHYGFSRSSTAAKYLAACQETVFQLQAAPNLRGPPYC